MAVKEFGGIERRDRFETRPILDRDVDIRVKFTVREMALLSKYLDKFTTVSEKINQNATDGQIDAYEKAVDECAQLIIRDDNDKKFVSDAVKQSDPDSDEFIDVRDFVDLLSFAMQVDEEKTEEDSGKVESGSKKS